MSVLLPGWTDEDQLNSPTQDGQADENCQNNCGETCDSMILQWALNETVDPDTIKDAIYGQGYTGYGYVGDLSTYLNGKGISTYYEQVSDADSARAQVIAWLQAGNPVVILLYADRVNQTGGHFVVAIGANDDSSLIVANPWGGWNETLSPAAFRQAYNSWLLHAICTHYTAPAPTPTSTQSSGSQGASAGSAPSGIATGPTGKVLITTTMMARSGPNLTAVIWPVQNVNKGAVLDTTGRYTAHWLEVVAGGKPVWVLTSNTKPA